jgi:hypothetical protein
MTKELLKKLILEEKSKITNMNISTDSLNQSNDEDIMESIDFSLENKNTNIKNSSLK